MLLGSVFVALFGMDGIRFVVLFGNAGCVFVVLQTSVRRHVIYISSYILLFMFPKLLFQRFQVFSMSQAKCCSNIISCSLQSYSKNFIFYIFY